jgi:1,4-alpha-glucan branching enzyme
MHEGSWGAEGTNHVWLNPETSWTYQHIYPAELFVREVCTAGKWREGGLAERIVKQLCRELLLLESSDWQFLITTGAARDYAEQRFDTHKDQFNELRSIWQAFQASGTISPEQDSHLAAIEQRDSIFADIDPGFWVAGAHATPQSGGNAVDGLSNVGSSSASQAGEARADATVSEVPKFISANCS